MSKAAATIRDVAREAGVSVATVSRVFNESALVGETTRANIRKVAERLHYIPNASARSLSIRRSEMIGLVLPDMYGEFFSEIIRGADVAAREAGYHLLVSSSHSNSAELERAIRALRSRVDGVVIMSPHLDTAAHVSKLLAHIPTIALNSGDDGEVDCILVDNKGGARQAVDHLLSAGHRAIGFVKGPEGNRDADERFAGYTESLRRAAVPLTPAWIFQGDFTEQSGARIGDELALMNDRPTALFVSNDEMAIGLMSSLRQHHIALPAAMSIAGFDDIAVSRYVEPPLTSVHVDIRELGVLAVRRILQRFRERKPLRSQTTLLPARLVTRDSVSSPSR